MGRELPVSLVLWLGLVSSGQIHIYQWEVMSWEQLQFQVIFPNVFEVLRCPYTKQSTTHFFVFLKHLENWTCT